jgi:hypothetical protein
MDRLGERVEALLTTLLSSLYTPVLAHVEVVEVPTTSVMETISHEKEAKVGPPPDS